MTALLFCKKLVFGIQFLWTAAVRCFEKQNKIVVKSLEHKLLEINIFKLVINKKLIIKKLNNFSIYTKLALKLNCKQK